MNWVESVQVSTISLRTITCNAILSRKWFTDFIMSLIMLNTLLHFFILKYYN
jgi:hypothetical protein